ncbi:dihydrofolate reductase family protein [Streptomyces sp. NPDC019531]|uniref:dihydrofolate reductase family protein n=1 Tax=Streptomyces sp. NPDC019531 TaxID=3365062 RepID=UPI00384DDC5F
MRKLTYFIACSIDGFIADESGDASFMYPFVVGEFAEYLKTEHPDTNPSHVRRLIGTDGVGLKEFDTIKVRELKAEDSEFGIHLCGGSKVAGELRDEIDELVIKTYPIVLGTGMPMFGSRFAVTEFTLDTTRTFDNGVVVRTYGKKS